MASARSDVEPISEAGMGDIRIVKGRYKARLFVLTEKGERWIKTNMSRINGDPAMVINSEYVDELIIEMEKASLVVDER